MKSHTRYEKNAIEKVRHETEAFIRHFQLNHCLFGTLTLDRYHPIDRIGKLWIKFRNRLRAHIVSYYAVLDNSHYRTPHIHFLIAVNEDITPNIDLEALGRLQRLKKEIRNNGAMPSQQAALDQLTAAVGSNESLRHYRALIRHYKELAGFSHIFDLWPIYSHPDAIAGYMAKAYRQAASSRSRGNRGRIVFSSRLPAGVSTPIAKFTRLTGPSRNYRDVLTGAAKAFGLPVGDPAVFLTAFCLQYPSELTEVVWEFVNTVPRVKGRPYPVAAIRQHFLEKLGTPWGRIPGMVALNDPAACRLPSGTP